MADISTSPPKTACASKRAVCAGMWCKRQGIGRRSAVVSTGASEQKLPGQFVTTAWRLPSTIIDGNLATKRPHHISWHFYIEDVCFDSKSSPRLVSLTTGRWLYSTNKIHLARPLGYALSIAIIATNLLPSKSIFQERKPTPNNFTRRFPFWNLRQKIFIFLTQNSHRKPLPITG